MVMKMKGNTHDRGDRRHSASIYLSSVAGLAISIHQVCVWNIVFYFMRAARAHRSYRDREAEKLLLLRIWSTSRTCSSPSAWATSSKPGFQKADGPKDALLLPGAHGAYDDIQIIHQRGENLLTQIKHILDSLGVRYICVGQIGMYRLLWEWSLEKRLENKEN